MCEKIMVSVYCLAYNHEDYIRDALEGFVTQKANFKYEVIVHDDASTDKTASIIREYEKKYPQIIKGIYQKENQYQKEGVSIVKDFIYPVLRGKYVAICEGDDYWIDTLKLQKQIDYMETHSDCTFCFSNGYIIDMDTKRKRVFIPYNSKDTIYFENVDRDYTLHNFHELSFIPTASFLFPKKCYSEMLNHCTKRWPAGDLRIRLYTTAQGYAHYVNDKMCVYRENVSNSIMTSWKKEIRKERFIREKKFCEGLMELNNITNHEFEDGLYEIFKIHCVGMLSASSSFDFLKNNLCRKVFLSLRVAEQIKICFKIVIPDCIIDFLRNYKK